MMGLRRISVLLYVVGWIWNTPAAGWDVGVRFYGRHVRQILHRWIFPMGPSQGIGVARRSDNTNGLRCSSACCLYLGGPRDAAACDESHSTACSSLPRHARRTLWTSALNCAHTAVDMFNKITVNVNVEDRLVNGAVRILKYAGRTEYSVRRTRMLFPEEAVGELKTREVRHKDNTSWTAIEQVVITIKLFKSPYSVVKKQFPVVEAEAITIYKSQGGTYEDIAVELSQGLKRTELYVALIRCTKMSGFYLIGKFVPPTAPSPMDKIETEMRRLSEKSVVLSCVFPSMFANVSNIVYHNIQSLLKSAHWADLQNFIHLYQPSLFLAAVTWTHQEDDISVEGYRTVLSMDCKKRQHAFGLAFYTV
ncbi:hypothetical protein AVEN_234802-2 [Araneus ventricosus]|uniref:Uncharacterized protein n=1 Tax=Araneus ventricosus TaxID=182803 RepID=A0A4Y2F845_ARAVE|nr:hypothetical protein AVEN_234802-2 [Araneus ventricosus]